MDETSIDLDELADACRELRFAQGEFWRLCNSILPEDSPGDEFCAA